MRGDRPYAQQLRDEKAQFTPHARGSTLAFQEDDRQEPVYPACAGIDPRLRFFRPSWAGLPRMRGDRPSQKGKIPLTCMFTPHARGSTP